MTVKGIPTLIDRRKFIELTAIGGGAFVISSLPGCGPREAHSGRGFTKEGLSRMHETMAGYVGNGKVPGLVTLVSRRGETHVEALGVKTLGDPAPMTRDTIFRIASMTKPVTAVATLILVEEGKVQLDETVERLLPELANRRVLKNVDGPLNETVPAKRPITVNDLLTFRMGFGLLFPMDSRPIQKAANSLGVGIGPPQPGSVPEPNEWIRRFATLPLMSQPGEQWLYNTGSDLLGILISRASGQDLETFFRERIFDKLGMKDTSFSVPAETVNRLPTSYMANPQTHTLDVYDKPQAQWSRPPAFPSGAGGLVSTVDDYLLFARMLLSKGRYDGGQIISAQSVDQMTSDHLTPQQKSVSGFFPGFFDNRGWGFGVSMITRPDSVTSVPGRYGWDGGLGTTWFNDPAQDLVAILMTQRALGDEAWSGPAFEKAVYAAIDTSE